MDKQLLETNAEKYITFFPLNLKHYNEKIKIKYQGGERVTINASKLTLCNSKF